MSNEHYLSAVETMLIGLLSENPDDFLVSIRVKPTNNIKIYIDSDHGLPIEKCVRYNRKLYTQIEESGLFPEGDFSLEISSPGVDEPLKLERQYRKNISRYLLITFHGEEALQQEGKLVQVTASDLLLETTTGKGKKETTTQHLIPFENIKKAVVQIQF